MSLFRKTVHCAQPPERVFDVVNNIEDYPQFVPRCRSAKIIESGKGYLVATLGFQVGFKQLRFSTRNTPQRPQSLRMELVDGPFRRLEGQWLFTPKGEGTDIHLEIEYEFSNVALAKLFDLFFPKLLDSLVSSFARRAIDRAAAGH